MPSTEHLAVKELKLDLSNFRTVAQGSESDAIHALISIHPDWFWSLAQSLVEDGYHPTENIIVLEGEPKGQGRIVKEGNRRIAALKMIHGYVSRAQFGVPPELEAKITSLSEEWKSANEEVPCAIYAASEADVVDKIVTLTHGKAEQAGRDKWNAVARARHNRQKNHASEPALDLLEKYLNQGKNLTPQEAERWGGEYPLTVLEEAVKRLAPRFGVASSRELADQYPKTVKYRAALENILKDVGAEYLDFKSIRDTNKDFAQAYGIPATSSSTSGSAASSSSGSASSTGGATGGASGTRRTRAVAVGDPRSVMRRLRKFIPKGPNREKLMTLLEEARRLKLSKHPHAFCFLLRSMFEISAKAYCVDHKADGLSAAKSDGTDKSLEDVLRDITKHLTRDKADIAMTKQLHGAMAEIAKKEGFLSVTSMNQLIHNPRFAVDETHISTLFHNIFPLLEAMNR